MSDGIKISVLDSWPQDSPPLGLVISRWLACGHNQCQTLISALAPKRKITQVFTLPSGVWFTSMARLATKQKLYFHPSECQTCWLQTCHLAWPGLLTQLLYHTHTRTHAHTLNSNLHMPSLCSNPIVPEAATRYTDHYKLQSPPPHPSTYQLVIHACYKPRVNSYANSRLT